MLLTRYNLGDFKHSWYYEQQIRYVKSNEDREANLDSSPQRPSPPNLRPLPKARPEQDPFRMSRSNYHVGSLMKKLMDACIGEEPLESPIGTLSPTDGGLDDRDPETPEDNVKGDPDYDL
ncbi:hypothetical protein BBP40_004798 [Aspergillus hancockii]|nr:hypothetical protein BBP40_004798 [Aspergillus hancockii]